MPLRGYFMPLRGCFGRVNPTPVAVTCDVNTDEQAEGVLIDAFIALAHDGPVDVLRDDKDQRVACRSEHLLDGMSIEQAEGDVQRLAEASVHVIVDFSCMHYGTDPQLLLRPAKARKARVVVGQELIEHGDGLVQQWHLGRLFDWVDESQDTIAAVDEPVTMALADSRRAQRSIGQLIERLAELGLDGIGAGRGTLYVDREDSPVVGQTLRPERFSQASLTERARPPAHSSPCQVETIGGSPRRTDSQRIAAAAAQTIACISILNTTFSVWTRENPRRIAIFVRFSDMCHFSLS